jgi:hypothetical protein
MPSQTGFAAIAAIAAIRFPLLSKRTWGGYPKRPWPGVGAPGGLLGLEGQAAAAVRLR